MLKETKYFCPKCGKQDIIITVDNGGIIISEDFSPNYFVNYKDHHWKCSCCDYKAKGKNFFIAERTLTDLEEARELIINFISFEYNSEKILQLSSIFWKCLITSFKELSFIITPLYSIFEFLYLYTI